jgi:hypothetical protein
VASLNEVLPQKIQDFETQIFSLIGSLSKAADNYRADVDAYTGSQAKKIKAQIENDANAAVAAIVLRVELAVKSTVENEIAKLRSEQASLGEKLMLAFIAGAIGGLFALLANILLFQK